MVIFSENEWRFEILPYSYIPCWSPHLAARYLSLGRRRRKRLRNVEGRVRVAIVALHGLRAVLLEILDQRRVFDQHQVVTLNHGVECRQALRATRRRRRRRGTIGVELWATHGHTWIDVERNTTFQLVCTCVWKKQSKTAKFACDLQSAEKQFATNTEYWLLLMVAPPQLIMAYSGEVKINYLLQLWTIGCCFGWHLLSSSSFIR